MNIDLSNSSFDFDNVAISKKSYQDILDDLSSDNCVFGLTHSLVMNEIVLYIEPTYSGMMTIIQHEDISISDIDVESEYNAEDGDDGQDAIRVTLSTTRLFVDDEDKDDLYPGEYSDEAMAFLSIQLDMFDSVIESDLIRGPDGKCRTLTVIDTDFDTTYEFYELMTFSGYQIEWAKFEDGSIQWLAFTFDETRTFSREDVDAFRYSKLRSYENSAFDRSAPVKAPCGHELEPTIDTVTDIYTHHLAEFQTVTIEGHKYARVPVNDVKEAILEVAEWPVDLEPVDTGDDNSSATTIARGYTCLECDIAYFAHDIESVRKKKSNQLPTDMRQVEIPDTDEKYNFLVFDAPYLPSDYMADYG